MENSRYVWTENSSALIGCGKSRSWVGWSLRHPSFEGGESVSEVLTQARLAPEAWFLEFPQMEGGGSAPPDRLAVRKWTSEDEIEQISIRLRRYACGKDQQTQ